MSRTKGSRNKSSKPKSISVHVRLSPGEMSVLDAFDKSPSKAIHKILLPLVRWVPNRRTQQNA